MTEPARKRRWPKVLAALAVLLLIGVWWVDRQLEPERLTALVLDKAGAALGLELAIDGTPDYALRPEPRLVLPRLRVRQPGAATSLLEAVRAEVSLPWSTLTGDGALVITRVELERPVLDLAALSAWLATRPPSDEPFELPTFTRGLQVTDGSVLGDGWALDMLGLDLPELVPGEPATLQLSGRFERQTTFVLFEGPLQLSHAGLASGFDTTLEGRLRDGELDVPVKLAANGRFDASGDTTDLQLAKLALRSQAPLPDLDLDGEVAFGGQLHLDLQGQLPTWPSDWPALPPPLSESDSPLAFTLDYDGPADLAAPGRLGLVRDDTRAEATLALPELLAWMDDPQAAVLPPLQATLSTPGIVVSGVTLEGVRVRITDDEEGLAEEGAAPEREP